MISLLTAIKNLHAVLASRRARSAYLILGLAVLSFAPHVLAADGFVPLAPIPGLTDGTNVGSVVKSADLANFFNNLYKYLIGVAATLAVIEIIWGGLEIATNRDNAGKILDAKGRIMQAVFGLILVLSPVLVFSIINPSILNLSINLDKIKTLSTPAAQQATTPTVITNPGTGQQTIIFNDGWYQSAVPTAYCFTVSSNSSGNYFCTRTSQDCIVARNGASGVTGACVQIPGPNAAPTTPPADDTSVQNPTINPNATDASAETGGCNTGNEC